MRLLLKEVHQQFKKNFLTRESFCKEKQLRTEIKLLAKREPFEREKSSVDKE